MKKTLFCLALVVSQMAFAKGGLTPPQKGPGADLNFNNAAFSITCFAVINEVQYNMQNTSTGAYLVTEADGVAVRATAQAKTVGKIFVNTDILLKSAGVTVSNPAMLIGSGITQLNTIYSNGANVRVYCSPK